MSSAGLDRIRNAEVRGRPRRRLVAGQRLLEWDLGAERYRPAESKGIVRGGLRMEAGDWLDRRTFKGHRRAHSPDRPGQRVVEIALET
jgi:hypothetical protein